MFWFRRICILTLLGGYYMLFAFTEHSLWYFVIHIRNLLFICGISLFVFVIGTTDAHVACSFVFTQPFSN